MDLKLGEINCYNVQYIHILLDCVHIVYRTYIYVHFEI